MDGTTSATSDHKQASDKEVIAALQAQIKQFQDQQYELATQNASLRQRLATTSFYQAILAHSQEAIAVRDMNNRLVYYNALYLQIFQHTSTSIAQLDGQALAEYPAETLQLLQQTIIPQVLHTHTWVGKLTLQTRQHQVFTANQRFIAITDAIGQVTHIACLTETTRLSTASSTVQPTPYLIHCLNQLIPQFFYIFDLKSEKYIYLNERLTQFLGYGSVTIQQLGGQLFNQFVHDEDLAQFQQKRRGLETSQTGEIVITDYRMRNPILQNQWHWFRGREMVFMRDEAGNATQILGEIEDITAYKQLEQALSQHEKRFELAIRGMNEGLWEWDLVKNTLCYFPRWLEIVGYQSDELAIDVATWQALIHPDDLTTVIQTLQAYLQGHLPYYEASYRLHHKAGHYVWVLDRGVADRNTQGMAYHLVGAITDLTVQLHVEAELRKAKETAEAANSAKSIFLANISHELRTPLNAILGYVQFCAADKHLSQERRHDINIIQRNGEHLLTLINDVLDLAKIESGYLSLEPNRCYLGKLLKETLEIFHLQAHHKNIKLTFTTHSHLPDIIHIDEKRLRQILINLLSNALKFTQIGFITLQLEFDNEKLQIQVKDTGIGIAPEYLDKIFLPFYQIGNNEEIKRVEGTGLGLTITKTVVELLKGKLEIHSELGKGSTFQVELPIQKISQPLDLPAKSPVIIGFTNPSPLILVVDDNATNRLMLKRLLQEVGFNVEEAINGEDALIQANLLHPQVIFMDIVMPIMSGYEAVRRLRQQDEFKKTIIIAISANAFNDSKTNSLIIGCNDFIAKPFQHELLLNCLQKFLDLNWIYEPILEQSSISSLQQTYSDTPNRVALSPEQAKYLYDLTQQGDVYGVMEYAKQLADTQENLRAICEEIAELALELREEEIYKRLQPYLQ
ncbi:PAS domain S-box [Beggiatoa alba B18LD]|uniref:histidine kinase n=1 Tax=Beggiatoa alba B18LD TaxID=395493 RepID=I3CIF6_9GAMM|nr:PAS domain-containing hybrid sensor histidine kinase/response regulator [Beggiatoa alba]EIJ43399.1 PAS domain S-box [Beggiatoa alba B18LD]